MEVRRTQTNLPSQQITRNCILKRCEYKLARIKLGRIVVDATNANLTTKCLISFKHTISAGTGGESILL